MLAVISLESVEKPILIERGFFFARENNSQVADLRLHGVNPAVQTPLSAIFMTLLLVTTAAAGCCK
jgi:hypothetical protein